MKRLHANESGAIMLLILAGTLVLFMVAMTLYDAGQASQDKMRVQTAADTAAYSHSVIKSRSMNVIAYANIIKRFFYAYLANYINAYSAIVAQMVLLGAQCYKLNLHSCYHFGRGLPMSIAETIELPFNLIAMDATPGGIGGNGRSAIELNQLERYQQYMFAITPWWAWMEATTRATGNGGLAAASWPPPPSSIGNLKSGISKAAGTVDWAIGTDLLSKLPSMTVNTDALPVTRRDRQVRWKAGTQPFDFSLNKGGVEAATTYCLELAGSMELLIPAWQTYSKSSDEPGGGVGHKGWKGIFILTTLVPVIGCAIASITYNKDGYLDWNINETNYESKNAWLSATSVISIAYKPRAGTMSGDGRNKLAYMKQDYNKNPLYQNEGYFSVARSEIVYKQPFESLETGFMSFMADIPFLSNRAGLQSEPDMWSPRWKAKNRPVALPGESLGSAIQGPDAGLGTVINDSIPFLLLGSVAGVVNSDGFSPASTVNDIAYIYRVGQSMTAENFEGVSK